MSIEHRIDKLEERYGSEEDKGCTIIIVLYEGTAPAPEGEAEGYIEANNLCSSCDEKGICTLYWDGQSFTSMKCKPGKTVRSNDSDPVKVGNVIQVPNEHTASLVERVMSGERTERTRNGEVGNDSYYASD